MHLIALSALLDPDTPAEVLALLAARGTDDSTVGYLLAHRNTPRRVLADLEAVPVALSQQLPMALSSPAATDETRRRLLAHCDVDTLTRSVHRKDLPGVVHEVTSRVLTSPTYRTAWMVFQHPDVDADTRVHAIDTLLASKEVLRAEPMVCNQILLAATGARPGQLRALAQRAKDTARRHARMTRSGPGHIVRACTALANLAEVTNPRQVFLKSIRTHLADGTFSVNDAIAHAPDEELASDLVAQHPGDLELHHVIARQVALRGTPVWRRAQFFAATGTVPATNELPADPDLAIGLYAPGTAPRAIVLATDVHLDADPSTLAALTDALTRVPAADPARSTGLARLLLHPATPAHARKTAQEHLGALPNLQPLVAPLGPLLHVDDMAAALGQMPTRYAWKAVKAGTAFAGALAAHLRPTVRPAWDDVAAARTALALAPTFTGTFAELARTALAVAR